MSGHSKWSTIKHKKALVDAKRGNVFTKMAMLITVAVIKGGGVGDVNNNFSLRLAVEKAKMVNMPKENIKRAIEKGMGKGKEGEIEEILLEGYGPGGVAVVIETMSNKHNRTVAEIKNIFEKQGGSLGEPGSVLYQFERVGRVGYEGKVTEGQTLEFIDQGVSEFNIDEEGGELYCRVDEIKDLIKYLGDIGMSEIVGEVVYKPTTLIKVKDTEKVRKLIELVMEHDDVQEVYTNVEW
ncbi:MAG: YebC/PmpR family DNA-binding transcriptional regulator [bacterium]